MYVCGVTPYGPVHVGHAMSYIIFDVLRRYLEYRGYAVRHVQNFTDVDDKLIERAHREGTTVEALAQGYIDEYFQDMGALNVLEAHAYPRVSQEVPRIVEAIGALVDKGFAYAANGDVYFRVTRASSYGKLSGRSLESMRAGARVEAVEHKEHPMDFALWKAAKPGEPQWDSPWGHGRPGWHIECSVMASTYLDQPVDIHGGGQDLIFPHHENEIAQSEALMEGAPFARFWVHNGLLQMAEEKMSKSTGNLVTVRRALERFSPDGLRLSVLISHYRSPATYSEEAIAGAERAMARLRQAALMSGPQVEPAPSADSGQALDPSPYRQRFLEAMDDDFNTPQALAALFDLAREINRGAEAGSSVAQARETLLELGREVLGLSFAEREMKPPPELEARIGGLVRQRDELREKRRFAEADQIRQELTKLGVSLTDTPKGTQWRWIPPDDPSTE